MSGIFKCLLLCQNRDAVVEQPPALVLGSDYSFFDVAVSCQECDDAWNNLSSISQGDTGLGHVTFMTPTRPTFLETSWLIKDLYAQLPHIRLDPQERLQFKAVIAAGSDASILEASWKGEDRVLKWVDDCKVRMRLVSRGIPRHIIDARMKDMLIKEYIMTRAAHGIGPTVYGVSEARPVGDSTRELPDMLQNTYFKRYFRECKAVKSLMQFIIMDRVGPCIEDFAETRGFDYLRSFQFTVDTLHILKKGMELLERLHLRGIVHGDIHGSNLAFKTSNFVNVADAELILIDFEKSIYIGDRIGTDQFGNPPVNLNARLLSPWHLQNQRLGPRDDVYRLLEMTANMLSRWKYFSGMKRLIDERIDYEQAITGPATDAIYRSVSLSVRLNCSMFRRSDYLNSEMRFGTDPTGRFNAHEAVVERLEDLHVFIKERYSHPDADIDYQYIHGEIDGVIQMFNL